MTTAEGVERARRAGGAQSVRLRWNCCNGTEEVAGHVFYCHHSFDSWSSVVEYERGEAWSKCPKCGKRVTQEFDQCEVVR